MNTPLEKLSLIASAFAVVDDPTADGNRAANARQTMRDVLAGHQVHVVSAGTYAARCDERDAYFREMVAKRRQNAEDKTTIAKLTSDNAALQIDRDKALAAAEAMRADGRVGAGWVSPEEHRGTIRRIYADFEDSQVAGLRRILDADPGEDLATAAQKWTDEAMTMMKECDAARARLAEVEAERAAMEAHHPRAVKMMKKGRPFFVVGADEPYAKCVAALIKNVEDGMGKWTPEDEAWARAALFVDVVDKAPPNAHTRLRRVEADLARVKAEAEGLREELATTLAAATGLAELRASGDEFKRRGGALASPTPTQKTGGLTCEDVGCPCVAAPPVTSRYTGNPTPAIEPVDTDDISATSVMLKGGAP